MSRLIRVRFYSLYERIWHWLQALCGVLLVLSGFSIAFPESRLAQNFESAVALHHLAAWVLLVNAALGFFYNLAGGLIRRYVPRSEEIFRLSMHHARYYLLGIFRGEPHPFEKTPEKRLLPLQKITYFIILNFVLPFLVVSGLVKILADDFPQLLTFLGGMKPVTIVHRLAAWVMASFILLHVYMTTTGRRWWTNFKTMLNGYEEVEQEDAHENP
jgi:thiosulfate reductase cytochrome b subunit